MEAAEISSTLVFLLSFTISNTLYSLSFQGDWLLPIACYCLLPVTVCGLFLSFLSGGAAIFSQQLLVDMVGCLLYFSSECIHPALKILEERHGRNSHNQATRGGQ